MTMRRYSGYCAWRGVLPEKDKPHIAEAVRKAYPELGSTLYFDIARTSHAVLYQLPGPRLNWLWYPPPPSPFSFSRSGSSRYQYGSGERRCGGACGSHHQSFV